MSTEKKYTYPEFKIPFTKLFPIIGGVSFLLVLGSLLLFFTRGLNYGVDFRGGAEIQVKFEKTIHLEEVRNFLTSNEVQNFQVQSIGEEVQNEFLVKVASKNDLNALTDKISSMFMTNFADSGVDIRKTDIVGPKAGEQLRNSAFQALAWSLLLIMVYVGLRFDFQYAPGAIVALIHDTILVIGVFCLTEKEFSLQIVGAILAIIGYSVNDTVVIFDRIREILAKNPKLDLRGTIDIAVNQTLPRTLLTSITTFLVSAIMYFMGGGVIHDFFFAMTLGIIIGTYSSIFVASPLILFFSRFQSAAKIKATA